MARRTRRDLSNKKIRRIVYKELDQNKKTPKLPSQKFSFKFLKPIFYGIVVVAILFGIYYGAKSLDFPSVLNNKSNAEKATKDIAETSQPPEEQALETSENDPTKNERAAVVNPVVQKTQIEVLNGCGVDGIALKTTKFLRKNEFDVVYMGNYKNFDVKETIIIDRIGNRENAEKLAEVLGINENHVEQEIDRNRQLDASLILGKDYKELTPFNNK